MNSFVLRRFALGVLITGAATSSQRAQALLGEPPANDNCINATALGTLPVSALGSNFAASSDIVTPCALSSGPFHNVWYSVIGTGGTLTATVCSASTTIDDTKISVFCGDCDQRVCVAGNDDNCDANINSLLSTASWCSVPGQVYLITIGGFDATTLPGIFELSVTDAGDSCGNAVSCVFSPPANDTCATAEQVTIGVSVSANNFAAQIDSVPFCQIDPPMQGTWNSRGVWYKVVGNGDELTASTCGAGTDFDTRIQVYCDCQLNCIDGNDDFCDLQSSVTWCSQSGQTYYVLVGGFDETYTGNLQFVVNDSGTGCTTTPVCATPPTGACCVNGQCVGTIIEADCATAGGAWFLGGDCGSFICYGACCDGTTGLCTDNTDPTACMGLQQTYHDHQSCAQLSPQCTQHTGACCDGTTGLCTDDVAPGNCLGVQQTWHKGELCAALNPPCTQHTGACCDGTTGICTDNALPGNCVGGQLSWHKDEPCSALNPPCTQHTGACCDGTTGLCTDNVLPGDCIGNQQSWYKGELCSAISPSCTQHTGACCDGTTGLCTDNVLPGDCVGSQQTWHKGELCAALNPPCSQHTGACCDAETGVCKDGVLPGSCVGIQKTWYKGEFCSAIVPPCAKHTGACCDGETGICTNGVLPADCVGPQKNWFKDELCSAIAPPCSQHTGACCDGTTGVCTDGVLPGNCTGIQQSWHKGEQCSALNPPCVQHTGACCDGTTGACSDGVLPGNCTGIQQSWHKGEQCSALNPPCVQHTGACCVTTPGAGGTCTDNTLPQNCAGPGQVWTKGTLCVDAQCHEATGACCDTLTGICTDNVLLGNCQGPHQQWTQGGTCAGVVCTPANGACCDKSTGTCTITISANCVCPDCQWTPNTTCDAVTCLPGPIPTVSQWGLAVLALVLLIGAKLAFARPHGLKDS